MIFGVGWSEKGVEVEQMISSSQLNTKEVTPTRLSGAESSRQRE